MQILSKLSPFTTVQIPSHDVLPLLEDTHGLEFLEEGDVLEDVTIDSVLDELFIWNEIWGLISLLADGYKSLFAKYNDSSMILRGMFHFLVHVARTEICRFFQWDENLVL